MADCMNAGGLNVRRARAPVQRLITVLLSKHKTVAKCWLMSSVFYSLFSVFCYAEKLPDPTRPTPIVAAPVSVNTRTDAQTNSLQSIIISSNRRAAIIDGKTVELGQKYGDARLVEVNEVNVVLQAPQGRQVLTLFPNVRIMQVKPKSLESRVRAGKKKPVAHKEDY